MKVTVPKGTPFIKTKLRDLTTDKVTEKNFKTNQTVESVTFTERDLEFLYLEGNDYLFLDIHNMEQVLVPSQVIGDKINYLKEGIAVKASFYGDTLFSIELPQFLELMITDIDGEEGDGPVSNANLEAILETGAKVEVPSFIQEGDIIKVDTKTGEYIQRV